MLTSVIIMQTSVGGSLKASIDRLLGSFTGAVWGARVTLTSPYRDILGLGLALAVALAALALTTLNLNYRVAPVIAIVVLLSTTAVQFGPVR